MLEVMHWATIKRFPTISSATEVHYHVLVSLFRVPPGVMQLARKNYGLLAEEFRLW